MTPCHTLAALALCVAVALPVAAFETVSLSNAVKVVEIPAGKAFKYQACLSPDNSGYMEIIIGDHSYKFGALYSYSGGGYGSVIPGGDGGIAEPSELVQYTTHIMNGNVVSGPCTVRLIAQESVYPGGQNFPETRTSGLALFTYEVYDVSGKAFTPSTGVVIPEDGEGRVQVIMESSADLVNWTQALPGTYGRTEPKRFFRLRIVNN